MWGRVCTRQRIEELEKAANNRNDGNMASLEASDVQQQAESHKAKGTLWHRKATLIDRQGKIMSSMYKEQQNIVLHVARLEQKYIK